jgi:SAM-dependent methyltransferase
VDDLAALRPARVLDVGCGTGKAAGARAGRGLVAPGVEPDARMAEVARGHGLAVEVATFEAWEPAGRRFDLLTFADSWHWVAPAVAVPGTVRSYHETRLVLARR